MFDSGGHPPLSKKVTRKRPHRRWRIARFLPTARSRRHALRAFKRAPMLLKTLIVVAIALIAPLGLAMGMPFPGGLRRTGGSLPAPPFYWGLNGIMSVIGSVTTVFVALIFGFQAAMLMGGACYLLAAVASRMAFARQLRES